MLEIGQPAPDFTLPAPDGGAPFQLSALRGRHVVLYFYPKDDTPGCTTQACGFRDQYEEFLALGAEVVGVSSDSAASHELFARKHRLPFPLLADTSGAVRKLYEVPRALLGLLPGRVTFVIDQAGIVRYIFNSLSGAVDHVANTKTMLMSMSN